MEAECDECMWYAWVETKDELLTVASAHEATHGHAVWICLDSDWWDGL